MRENFFLITGGPGVGKTSLIEALRAMGEHCVDETHRRIIREEVARGGTALPWLDEAAYLARAAREDIAIFEAMAQAETRVFFDRGVPDSLTPSAPEWMRDAARSHRYNRAVFVPPPWAAIYTQDAERKQTFEDCQAVHALILRQLAELDYVAVEVPPGAPEERAAFVLRIAKGPAGARPSQIT